MGVGIGIGMGIGMGVGIGIVLPRLRIGKVEVKVHRAKYRVQRMVRLLAGEVRVGVEADQHFMLYA